MRNKKPVPFKSKLAISIVVDGDTESWYLKMLLRNEQNLNVHIKPEIPQRKKLADQYAKVIEVSRDYDKVFWIVDLDVILSESKTTMRGKQTPIDTFLKYRNTIKQNYENVDVIINQPCFEFWLLSHFRCTTQQFTNCESALTLLKHYLTDYSKTQKYFTKQDNDIYLKLKDNLSTAICNSKSLKEFDSNNCYNGFTEMHKLFDALGIK